MKKILIFMILLPFLLISSEKGIIVLDENFRSFQDRSPDAKTAGQWKKQHPGKGELPDSIPVPEGWFVPWNAFAPGTKVLTDRKEYRMVSPGRTTITAPLLPNRFGTYAVEITVSGQGTVHYTLRDTGMEAGVKFQGQGKLQENQDSRTGKMQTFRLECTRPFRGKQVKLELSAEGDVVFHRVIIRETPSPDIIIAEGTVLARSALPDPKKFGYPDSNYTLHFRGHAILSGKPCSRELMLVVPGFAQYRNLPTSRLKKGDRIRVVLAPPSVMTEKQQRVNQADELTLFHLDSYYALECTVLKHGFTSDSRTGIPFRDPDREWISVFERRINPPVPEEDRKAQQDWIRAEQSRMDQLLTREKEDIALWDRRFRELWEKEYAKDTGGRNRPVKGIVWREIDGSYWALPEKYHPMANTSLTSSCNMASILAFRDMLEVNGVQLIVQIIPDFYDIAARIMVPAFRNVPDYRCARIVKQFLDAGIETYYTSDLLIGRYNLHPFMFSYPTDSHPADTCQDVITEQMCGILERFHFPRTIGPASLTRDTVPFQKAKNVNQLWPSGCDIGSHQPGTPRSFSRIQLNGKTVRSDRKSPILFIGNSFFNTPIAGGASYARYIAYHGHYASHYRTLSWQGPFTTIFRDVFTDPESWLKGKRVCVIPVGVTSMQYAVTWYNVRRMDSGCRILSGRILKHTCPVRSPLTEQDATAYRKKYLRKSSYRQPWESFSDRKEFLISGPSITLTFPLDRLDPERPAACLIPCMVPEGSRLALSVNGQQKEAVPESGSIPCWSNIVFELPAGCRELELKVFTEKREAFLAFRDILIYQ